MAKRLSKATKIKRFLKRELKGIDREMARLHPYIVLIIALIAGHELVEQGNQLGLILLTVSYTSLGYHVRKLVNRITRRRNVRC